MSFVDFRHLQLSKRRAQRASREEGVRGSRQGEEEAREEGGEEGGREGGEER